jgi:hypothetical protein
VSKTDKPDGWPFHCIKAEQHLRKAGEYLELGQWDKGLMALEQVQKHVMQARWNALYRLGHFAETDN